jgi:hypothetical protein
VKWSVTTPPAGQVTTWANAKLHLRIDDDAEQTYVTQLIAAAEDQAQEELGASLLRQTITATYYVDDVGLTPSPTTYGGPFDNNAAGGLVAAAAAGGLGGTGRTPFLPLRRGPVAAVVSVTDANGRSITGYVLEASGRADRLRFNVALVYPVTVVYTAGGATAADVPAAVKLAILCHVATLYENRESVTTQGGMKGVPHSLEMFYRTRRRFTGIG